MDLYFANILPRLEAGERIKADILPTRVLNDLASAGWSVHLLTGELISAPATATRPEAQ